MVEAKDAPASAKPEPYAVDVLIASLLDPPDLEQRIHEYDWCVRSFHSCFSRLTAFLRRYTHYHADDLSSHTLGEEKDLQLYARAARLAGGDEVDHLLVSGDNGATGWTVPGSDDTAKANAQFYDSWLKA